MKIIKKRSVFLILTTISIFSMHAMHDAQKLAFKLVYAIKYADDQSGYVEKIIKDAVALGIPINERSTFGDLPLAEAATLGSDKIVDLLLTHKARINDETHKGCTPLFRAVYYARLSTINLLLARGASLDCSLLRTTNKKLEDITKNQDIQNLIIQERDCREMGYDIFAASFRQ